MEELKHAYALANALKAVLIEKGIATEDKVNAKYQIERDKIHEIEVQQSQRLASVINKLEEDRLCNKIIKFFKRK